jgi:DNA topoisomerase-3
VKSFEEDDSAARETDIISPTDGKPLMETLRGYKSKDGELMIYKVIGNRKMAESEVKDLLSLGQIGPLDGFRSKKGKPFSAVLKYNTEEKKAEFVFDGQRDASGAIKIDFTGLQPIAEAPAPKFPPGSQVYETPQSFVVRSVVGEEDKVLVRCSKRILSRDIPLEQFMKMLQTGKTDLLEKFWSQRTRRPFSAFLVLKEDMTTGFEFMPRAPKDPNAPARGRKPKKKPPEALQG